MAEDIRSVIWAKLLVNSVFSGLGAVAGQTYAEVVSNPTGKDVALRMWREGYEVGLAQGLHPGKVLGVEAAALAEGDKRRSPPPWKATAPPTRRCSRTWSAAPSPRSTYRRAVVGKAGNKAFRHRCTNG